MLQKTVQSSLMPSASLTFDGLASADNLAAFSVTVLPPDTSGDVGPGHYVEMVNSLFRVFDKTGAPLTAKLSLPGVFAGAGISVPCTLGALGTVLYDSLADRWLLSALCPDNVALDHQLIAVSKTADAAGAYFLYDFVMPNDKRSILSAISAWGDGYYMADVQLDRQTGSFGGSGAFAFDRARMLAGSPTARCLYFDLAVAFPFVGPLLPADLDGLTPPPAGTPAYFAYLTANEFADPADALRIFELHADFATPTSSTFSERSESPLPVASFDPRSPGSLADIEQPPPATSGAFLDSVSDWLLRRLAYRNFGGHESLVVAHTVNVSGVAPTTPANMRAGVRYYELRRTLPSGQFTVHEQATYAPADSLERWMGSAAMDGSGDLVVGFSASSVASFPSIRYAGRLSSDPPGGLFQGEAQMIAGTGAQTTTLSRWGSYSTLTVDPDDDCTFWYANEYYTAASAAANSAGWLTGIGRFTLPTCTPLATGILTGVVTDLATGAPIAGAAVATSGGLLRITNAAGAYSMTVPPGSYDLTASATYYESATASGVTVAAGGTTTRGFALRGLPAITAGAAAPITAEGCGGGNGTLDPAEAVTVSLQVTNVGRGPTVNLVGTLLAGGGVTEPGPPQTYGVVPAGGSAARSFTFRAAGSCGGSLTATFQLRDGATDFGTAVYSYALGQTPTVTYSSGNLNLPITFGGMLEVPISVPDAGSVVDVDARVRLGHTSDGNLILGLLDPGNTIVDLSSHNGGGGDDYGTGAADCSGQPTVFDDSAASAIFAGAPPFDGSFRPQQALSAFAAHPTAGAWKLRVSDTGPTIEGGTMFCFQLQVQRASCCVDPAGVLFRDGYESGNLAAWSGKLP